MGKVFRARFVGGLRKSLKKELPFEFCKSLFKKDWVVYCKRPFLGPAQYTHKIATSNHRIKNLDDPGVTFSVKDYRHGGRKSLLRLNDAEFIRRFSLHILPKGFVRIRHYGFLSSYHKKTAIDELRKTLKPLQLKEKRPLQHRTCPTCRKGKLVTLAIFTARGPPTFWLEKLKGQENK